MPAEEILPAGVGRVPLWWMEITPHYTLDEEDEEARRTAEDHMAFYYMQLAAADDAGIIMPDGTPKLGPDLKPMTWTPLTPWNGRTTTGTTEAAGLGPGGRNFKPGHAVLDPKLFNIMESDPDYHAYLTGAKLPPGYFEKMGELASSDLGGTEGIMNNLKQTDYGRYGRQAETPNFKPDWAKKKLRSTATGTNIRQGQYDDSPNKHTNRRRVESSENAPKISATLDHDENEPAITSTPGFSILSQIQPICLEPVAKEEPVDDRKKKMVRKVRKIRKKETKEELVPAPTEQHKRYEHSDYYHNAKPKISEQELKLKEQQEKLKRLQELQRQQQLLRDQQEREARLRQQQQEAERSLQLKLQKQQQEQTELQQRQEKQVQEHQLQQQHQAYSEAEYDEESYEEEIIEEVLEDDEYTEGSYEEEVIEDDDDDDNELTDLQAILAAKQAELQRLQAQM